MSYRAGPTYYCACTYGRQVGPIYIRPFIAAEGLHLFRTATATQRGGGGGGGGGQSNSEGEGGGEGGGGGGSGSGSEDEGATFVASLLEALRNEVHGLQHSTLPYPPRAASCLLLPTHFSPRTTHLPRLTSTACSSAS